MKYNTGQLIWYINHNKIHSASVLAAQEVVTDTPEASIHFGKPNVKYATCHGIFDETVCFASKAELIESL